MTHHSVEQTEVIVNRFSQCGLSIREFSELKGIAKSSLYSWTKKFNKINTNKQDSLDKKITSSFSHWYNNRQSVEEKLIGHHIWNSC